jgi:hypothetical protein
MCNHKITIHNAFQKVKAKFGMSLREEATKDASSSFFMLSKKSGLLLVDRINTAVIEVIASVFTLIAIYGAYKAEEKNKT